jgi:hypothetical protein
MTLVPGKEPQGSAATQVDVVNTAAKPVLSKSGRSWSHPIFETNFFLSHLNCADNCSNFVPAGVGP